MSYASFLDSVYRREEHRSLSSLVSDKLIIGCATGYHWSQIALFVESLRARSDARCCLIIFEDAELQAYLASKNIDFSIVPPEFDEVDIVVRRVVYSYNLLRQYEDVNAVLFTDVRDVMFNADPFGAEVEGLEAYCEGDEVPLKDHAFTRKWVKRCFGTQVSRRLDSLPALCVGTIVAPRMQMLALLEIMIQLLRIPRDSIASRFGGDQAAFNLAIHLNMVPATIFPSRSRIATVGINPGVLEWSDGTVTYDGFAPAIVHQFDRQPAIAQQVLTAYGIDPVSRSRPAEKLKKRWISIKMRLPEWR